MDKQSKTLWNIRQDLWNVMEQLSDPDVDIDSMNEALEIQGKDLKDKAPGYAAVIKEKEARGKFLKERGKALNAAGTREINIAKKLKENLDIALKEASITNFDAGDFRFSFRASKIVITLVPEDQLPESCFVTKREVSKTKLADALNKAIANGESVAWAKWEERQNLQIK